MMTEIREPTDEEAKEIVDVSRSLGSQLAEKFWNELGPTEAIAVFAVGIDSVLMNIDRAAPEVAEQFRKDTLKFLYDLFNAPEGTES